MINFYDKDMKVLKKISVIIVLGSLLLIISSFFYFTKKNSDINDFSYTIVYNTDREFITRNMLNNEYLYKFSVIGYNNSNKDRSYKIYASKGLYNIGNRVKDKLITLELLEKDKVIFGPIEPLGLSEFGILLGEIVIPANTNDYYHQYCLKVNGTSDEMLLGDRVNNIDNSYSINISVK